MAGIDPYFFGPLFVLNAGIGVITPPVGTVLFVICGSAGISMGHLVRKLLPFLLLEVFMLLMLLLFPDLSIVPMKWLT
jgi:TRAP-type C4-dicarboxylate transport system permease large subunit